MTTSRPPDMSVQDYALSQAQEAFLWYMDAGKGAKVRARIVDGLIIATSAAVTISGILDPSDARVPAILGALAAAVTAVRAMNHWRENWVRFILARTELRSQMRLYRAGIAPYDDPDAKASVLIQGSKRDSNAGELGLGRTLRQSRECRIIKMIRR